MGKINSLGRVTFIGGGAMGEAILKGVLKAKLVGKKDVVVVDPSESRQVYLRKSYGITATANAVEAVGEADVVVLAVKPQMAEVAITKEIAAAIMDKALVISIMGSVDLAKLNKLVPGHQIVRVMPNTPLAVGAGMTAIAPDAGVSEEYCELVATMFGACGEVVQVGESAMEAITAISGCGPGYVFVLIDALADAGVNAGLPRNLAIQLAAQTFAGSGKMAVETGIHPAQLRDQVTSPGGTTIAGIHALESHGVRAAMYDAVLAVLHRSEELKG